ncbi:MAG TPA: hypothetical protein ENN20_01630 [Candidatus Marinimicrobia bacterium]|nr:hypothetical protein [Candidatus Neomarinimicrobiota bacterium]
MGLSVFIAKIFALIYVASGIAVLIGNLDLNGIVSNLKESTALTFLAGCAGIIAGTALVQYHNLWVSHWRIIITIIGWIMLIGGVITVIIPNLLVRLKGLISYSKPWGVFMIFFGLLMGYFGFFA